MVQVKQQMTQNLAKVEERGENLEKLQDRAG